MGAVLEVKKLFKIYRNAEHEVSAVDNVSLSLKQGEMKVLRGSSGSGKSTLLLSCGGLLSPTEGEVIINGQNVYNIKSRKRALFRANNIGFVFQRFHLIPYLNVLENIMMVSIGEVKDGKKRAMELAEHFGITTRLGHLPRELSVGECQRVALARAMFNSPSLILADEPTGNLDPENSNIVLNFLEDYANNGGAVLMVTHDIELIKSEDNLLILEKGRII